MNVYEVVNNISGLDDILKEALIKYINDYCLLFNNNPIVVENLLTQIKNNVNEVEIKDLDGSSGAVSNMSKAIFLSSNLEEWNIVNTFLHELTHKISTNDIIEEGIVITLNAGLKYGSDDQEDSIFGPVRSWNMDGNNYAYKLGTAVLDEWITEWIANKISEMKNVEIKKYENGFFRIKTSHGYDGSNIMNLLEVTFGTQTIADLLTGLTIPKEQRNCVLPLYGFKKMNEMYDSDKILKQDEKELLLSLGKYIKTPTISIYLLKLIYEYNYEKDLSNKNNYLMKMINLILRTYITKFDDKLNKCNTLESFGNLYNELKKIQLSLAWNLDLNKLNEMEYFAIYKELVNKFMNALNEKKVNNKYSDLIMSPEEIFRKFEDYESQFGHNKNNLIR